jgi:hypothetical protein
VSLELRGLFRPPQEILALRSRPRGILVGLLEHPVLTHGGQPRLRRLDLTDEGFRDGDHLLSPLLIELRPPAKVSGKVRRDAPSDSPQTP